MKPRSILVAAIATLLLLAGAALLLSGDDDDADTRRAGEMRVDSAALAAGDSGFGPGLAGPDSGRAGGIAGDAPGGPDSPVSSEPGRGGTGVGGAGSGAGSGSGSTQGSTPGAGVSGDAGAGGSTGAGSPSLEPAAGAASDAESQETVEDVLRATGRRYEGVRSLRADFRQELTNVLIGRTTRSAGTLYQRQPDRFAMKFSDPAGDIIVSDGEYFWVYYPSSDPRQVIRSSAGGAGGLDLRAQFVGDPVRRFEATSQGREEVRGRDTHVLTLTPRQAAGYRRLKVWIDAEDQLVRRFELTEDNGNVRRFELTDLRINPTLPDDVFRFEPPAGAVVVTR